MLQHLVCFRVFAFSQGLDQPEQRCLGKFRRPPKTAMPGVEAALQVLRQPLEDLGAGRPVGGRSLLQPVDGLAQLAGLLFDILRVQVKPLSGLLQQVAEPGQVVSWLRGEVGAGKKRRQMFRVEENGQRPAAAPAGQQLMG